MVSLNPIQLQTVFCDPRLIYFSGTTAFILDDLNIYFKNKYVRHILFWQYE